jgi:uncharacterized protein
MVGVGSGHLPPYKGIVMAAKFEVYKTNNGEFRWHLKSDNGQIIATSGEGYTSKAGATNGVEAVKRDVADAATEDKT